MTAILMAFGLTLFAGLATGVGSAIAFFAKRTNYRFLSIATGFSAGVMLYVSFVEIFVKGLNSLALPVSKGGFGPYWGHWINAAAFFGGLVLIAVIDRFIPSAENPHTVHSKEETVPLHDPSAPVPNFERIAADPAHAAPGAHDHRVHKGHLLRMGLFTALALTIHNFPEGLATFLAALHDPQLGLAIAIAIALHNIPEGISVSVPIYYATGSRRKAFGFSLASGLAEPVGAGIAYLLILALGGGQIPPTLMGVLFAGVAGIMVFISLDELLPTSRAYGRGHDSLYGLLGGMVMMALSLLLMK
ncbi:MAG: zinc transporter ZupT [Planctomycetes bacterium]|nr:zinc transporter ZupT [Planctomycetota bacterium]